MQVQNAHLHTHTHTKVVIGGTNDILARLPLFVLLLKEEKTKEVFQWLL